MFFSQSRKSKKLPSIQITAPTTNTLEALDLHSPNPPCYNNNNNTDQRRGSLDGSNDASLVSNLNYKSRSETQLCEDGNANKTKIQNLNWTKTFASIDNKYDRAQAATNQEAVKKKLNLIQRRISMELKVDHLEKYMHTPEKKSAQNAQLNSTTSPICVRRRVEELKSQLKTIDADLKATDEQRDVAIKGICANKNKEYDVIHLLEETAKTPNKNNLVKKPAAAADQLEARSPNSKTTTLPQIPRNSPDSQFGDKKRNTERRRTISRLQAFSNALDIRKNFRSIHRTNKHKNNDCNLPEDAKATKGNKASQNTTHQETPEKERRGHTSETSSSDEDHEIQTVISKKTLEEIAAFEKRIEDHMKRRREYDDFLFIDEDEYT